MEIEVNKMNIYQKLSAITDELKTVGKNLTVNQTKTSSYKAVSERDILDAVKPVEAKYGIYSYPASREILESNLLESESTYNGNTTKKTTFMTRIKTVYRFINCDNPDESIETIVFSEGIDAQDKGSGKAMTYADKYALMKAYKISTGDDPDVEPSREVDYAKSKKTTSQLKSETNAEGDSLKRLRDEMYNTATEKGFNLDEVTILALHFFSKKPMEFNADEIKKFKSNFARNADKLRAKINELNGAAQ